MSKFSPSEKLTKKIENSQEEFLKKHGILAEELLDDNLNEQQIAELDPDLFGLAIVDESEAERTGYSNYSYWGSTVRMFFKNKVAVFNLIVMLVLVLFTFIQPHLPNQIDPNLVNYYDSKAVWYVVDSDGSFTVDGMKRTQGGYAAEPGSGEILAYIQTPADWGTPVAIAYDEEGEETQLSVQADPANSGWYWTMLQKEAPYLAILSEDLTESTYYNAVWLTVTGDKNAVYSSGVKQTAGELITDVPDGKSLAYVSAPSGWGVPKLKAQGSLNGSDAETVSLKAVDGENGWFYGFFPTEKNTLILTSEDGSQKGMNRATVSIGLPQEAKIVKGFIENKPPNKVYWFGTNDIGQDLWARMWAGTRTSLFIGIVVAVIEAIIGILAGLLWGYVRKLDFLFTEMYNLIDNIPSTIILLLAAYVMRPGIRTIIIAMSLTRWIGLARFIRNQVLIIRDRDFNLASRCLGTPTRRVITRNLLPQMVSVVMLRMALAIPDAIGSEVFLSYINLGLPISIPSLGNLINKGRTMMMAPSLRYQLFIPAIILSIITICFYLVGNAFSDAADPKNHV